eukprot:TRINITY_DN2538_c0_g1_i4.p3 TRINITY_DN2538_c0_g1~~TRINITY_DN2538_c0_g1_i4.p3  ORF type:complete len:122 (-),score=58.37 TRINITY_DN2538_c0_g1_i4:538-861(-)
MWARIQKALVGKASHATILELQAACRDDDPATVARILGAHPHLDPLERPSARHPCPLGAACLTGSLGVARAIMERHYARRPEAKEQQLGGDEEFFFFFFACRPGSGV